MKIPPIDTRIVDRYPWGSVASPTHAKRGRGYQVVEVTWNGVVPRREAGTREETSSVYGTDSRDRPYGTSLDGWRPDPLALPAAVRPSPPGYFVSEPLLLKEWDGLTGTFTPPDERDLDGKLKPYQVDHWCHTEDLTCPAGEACQHVRCLNGDHMWWVSPQVNSVRMQIRKRRREQWLSGERSSWSTSVAEEAELWLRERRGAAAVR